MSQTVLKKITFLILLSMDMCIKYIKYLTIFMSLLYKLPAIRHCIKSKSNIKLKLKGKGKGTVSTSS